MLYRLILTLFLTLSVLITKDALAEKQASIIYDAEMPQINDSTKGSYAQLASLIDKYRAQSPSTFFIFGGDSLGPSMISSMDRGAHIIDVLNSLAPNVMAVSKRELSYEEDELILRTYEAAFPIVSSNLFEPDTQQVPEGIKAYAILQQGQVKLGFMSILDPIILEKYPTKRLEVAEPESVIRETVKKIREQNVDLIVMHYSTYTPLIDQLLAEGVIDVALFKDQNFDSSVHSRSSKHQNNIQVTEKSYASVIQLAWQEGSPSDSLTIKSATVNITDLPSKPQVLQQEAQYDNRLNSLLNEAVGTTNTSIDLDRKTLRTSENNFANFVADSFKRFTGAQITLINSGTFRGNKQIKAAELDQGMHNQKTWFISGFLLLAGVVIATLAFYSNAIKRLKKLTRKIHRMTEDSNDNTLYMDEIDELFQAFEGFSQTIDIQKQRLEALSLTDSLTNIANRRAFDLHLFEQLAIQKNGPYDLSVLLIDVDFFKQYNDYYGHISGDEALQKIAAILDNSIDKKTDLTARYGGEEFVIVLTDKNVIKAKQITQQIQQNLSLANIEHKGSELYQTITVSIGIVTIHQGETTDTDTLMKKADTALYHSKHHGRNRATHFNDIT